MIPQKHICLVSVILSAYVFNVTRHSQQLRTSLCLLSGDWCKKNKTAEVTSFFVQAGEVVSLVPVTPFPVPLQL